MVDFDVASSVSIRFPSFDFETEVRALGAWSLEGMSELVFCVHETDVSPFEPLIVFGHPPGSFLKPIAEFQNVVSWFFILVSV
jgi:hypothetical protein